MQVMKSLRGKNIRLSQIFDTFLMSTDRFSDFITTLFQLRWIRWEDDHKCWSYKDSQRGYLPIRRQCLAIWLEENHDELQSEESVHWN